MDRMGFWRIHSQDLDCPVVRDPGPRVRSESIDSEVRLALFIEFLTDPRKNEMSPAGIEREIQFQNSSVLQESSDRRSMLSESEHSEWRIRRFGVSMSRRPRRCSGC